MRFQSYLNSAVQIIQSYHGNEPFHHFIKKYFSAHKKYGSGDRKQIASLCYNYFRMGNALKSIPLSEKIIVATFLCSNKSSSFLESIKPEWNEMVEMPVQKKITVIGEEFKMTEIFPLGYLSEGINANKFNYSFLIQPNLFLRARPGNLKRVTGKLAGAGISYTVCSNGCVALPNASKVDSVIDLDKEAVVQDFNSQRVGEFVKEAIGNKQLSPYTSRNDRDVPEGGKTVVSQSISAMKQPATGNRQPASYRVWDCCAASGGKSIMAYDIDPTIDLTVSDKRESILENLQQRFLKAGIKKYKALVVDLVEGIHNRHLAPTSSSRNDRDVPEGGKPTGNRQPATGHLQQATFFNSFDLIICDAPCTGSGTWSRTPEQLYYFKKETIEKYAVLQKKIVENIIPSLKPGGYLLYITCSVFKKENEDVVKYITENFKLQLIRMETLKGYEMKADTMFAALFTAQLK